MHALTLAGMNDAEDNQPNAAANHPPGQPPDTGPHKRRCNMSDSLQPSHESLIAGERAAGVVDAGERERLMAEFSIAFNGRHYAYDIYRYDHLADAVAYARLQRSKPARDTAVRAAPSLEQVEDPDESQRVLMATLGITFNDGIYRLGEFRYDRLANAVDYARLQLQPPRRV
jgi:hypothetical protein